MRAHRRIEFTFVEDRIAPAFLLLFGSFEATPAIRRRRTAYSSWRHYAATVDEMPLRRA